MIMKNLRVLNKLKTECSFDNNKYLLLFTAIILFLGIFFRLQGIISRSLEYDEIWTLLHYSNKSLYVIFTKLATPNNHPINYCY